MSKDKIINVDYHYGHSMDFIKKSAKIEIVDKVQGIINLININQDIRTEDTLIKFSQNGIKTLFDNEVQENQEIIKITDTSLEIDSYCHIAAIHYKVTWYSGTHRISNPYIYNEKIGYFKNIKESKSMHLQDPIGYIYKPADDFGYVIFKDNIPKIIKLLIEGLISIENIQKGIIKVHISSYDKYGYLTHLFPKAMIHITQNLDKLAITQDLDKLAITHKLNELALTHKLDELLLSPMEYDTDILPIDLIGHDHDTHIE